MAVLLALIEGEKNVKIGLVMPRYKRYFKQQACGVV
jgi:hypothetical protein